MWSAGRSLSLLDPTYASKYIPIIASVSEHQPPAWNSYFTDVHILVLLAPLGLIACFRPMTDASLFLILYGVTAVYFSGVMVGHLCMFPMFSLELNIAVWNNMHSTVRCWTSCCVPSACVVQPCSHSNPAWLYPIVMCYHFSHLQKLRVSHTDPTPKDCSAHFGTANDTSLPQQHAVIIGHHSYAPSIGT